MRTFAHILINLILLTTTAVTGGWVTTTTAYLHASHHARTAMLAGVVLFFFAVACVALRAVPSKAQLAKRKKSSAAGSYVYGTARKR